MDFYVVKLFYVSNAMSETEYEVGVLEKYMTVNDP